jgi:hypothetical protein
VAVSHPVFISYARSTHAGEARRLPEALVAGGVPVSWTRPTSMPVISARRHRRRALRAAVVVCFCDEPYFSSWYCLREFHVALRAFNALVRDGGSELGA